MRPAICSHNVVAGLATTIMTNDKWFLAFGRQKFHGGALCGVTVTEIGNNKRLFGHVCSPFVERSDGYL
jgi:hypothetical protein